MWKERFWKYVDKRGPIRVSLLGRCWEWTGAKTNGYGVLRVAERNVRASHLAFEIAHGKRPSGMALHRCDAPSCVNPAHLFDGTQLDNMRDAKAKGRVARNRGEAAGRAKFSARQVARVRAFRKDGVTQVEVAKIMGCPRSRIADIDTRSWKEG